MRSNDTIAAIATPHGKGGVAVVRLSGPQALAIALRHLSAGTLEPRHATYCRFDELDDIVATLYPAPHSYTGDETVEFSCHGSPYVQQALLQTLLDDGARLAEAGEYTLRAFLSHHLDLSQAEAVADLIDASTPAQHRLAISQLRGGYAQRLKEMRQQLLDLTALLELELDFSQEDVEFADRSQLHTLLEQLISQNDRLLTTFALGNAMKEGVPVAIIGSPNVGKSTLLNALLGDDRAIVSPVPGTTRDTVEGMLTIEGVSFRLVDTAGLRETDDTVERLGIERSRRAYDDAMVVVHVVDTPQDVEPLAAQMPQDGKRHIVVQNKCDLGTDSPTTGALLISALTGEGIDRLKQALVDAVDQRSLDEVLLCNVRHRDALMRVQEALQAVESGLESGVPTDLVAVDLRDALYHLGSITGEVSSDEILGNIFGRFCVGK